MIKDLLKFWPRRLFLKKISWFVIAITGIMLIMLIGLSIYGTSVGELLVSLDYETQLSLSLSESGAYDDATTLLSARGIKGIRDVSYVDIPEDIEEGYGLKSDTENSRYFAYSFFLKNTSEIAVGYVASLRILKATMGIDQAARVMLIYDGESCGRVQDIYARPKADGTPETHFNNPGDTLENKVRKEYGTTPFYAEDMVCSFEVPVINIGEIHKYTIVLWLEGWDEQCTDSIIGGGFELKMDFTIMH